MPLRMSDLLAFALTGENVALAHGECTAQELLGQLSVAGWDQARITAHAQACWESDQPWPHSLPQGSLAQVSPAQWYAALIELRIQLGLDTVPTSPSRRTELTPQERLLLDEAPPHYGG